eukprot:scaffold459_cov249-Pinguiococcus_pyrenoidosus.AAC.9
MRAKRQASGRESACKPLRNRHVSTIGIRRIQTAVRCEIQGHAQAVSIRPGLGAPNVWDCKPGVLRLRRWADQGPVRPVQDFVQQRKQNGLKLAFQRIHSRMPCFFAAAQISPNLTELFANRVQEAKKPEHRERRREEPRSQEASSKLLAMYQHLC